MAGGLHFAIQSDHQRLTRTFFSFLCALIDRESLECMLRFKPGTSPCPQRRAFQAPAALESCRLCPWQPDPSQTPPDCTASILRAPGPMLHPSAPQPLALPRSDDRSPQRVSSPARKSLPPCHKAPSQPSRSSHSLDPPSSWWRP